MLIARLWDPCAIISAMLCLGLGGSVGVLQFRATFRARAHLGYFVAAILFGFGLLSIAAFAVSNAEFILKHGFDAQLFPFALEVLVAGMVLVALGVANGYCAGG
jgi:hypothetical protein